jgi:hypothetical protein
MKKEHFYFKRDYERAVDYWVLQSWHNHLCLLLHTLRAAEATETQAFKALVGELQETGHKIIAYGNPPRLEAKGNLGNEVYLTYKLAKERVLGELVALVVAGVKSGSVWDATFKYFAEMERRLLLGSK